MEDDGLSFLRVLPSDLPIGSVPNHAGTCLGSRGCEVEFFGAQRVRHRVGRLCRKIHPTLVGIGVAPLQAVAAARHAIALVREAVPEAKVIAGGWGALVVGPEVLGVDEVVPSNWTGLA